METDMSPDIDAPLQNSVGSTFEPPVEQIDMIADMGFTAAQARKALMETVRHSLTRRTCL